MTEPKPFYDGRVHPVQVPRSNRTGSGQISREVTLRAYEVYRRLYGSQEALITGGCRGGFSVGELIAFLYARSFPEAEWREREREAIRGMNLDARRLSETDKGRE